MNCECGQVKVLVQGNKKPKCTVCDVRLGKPRLRAFAANNKIPKSDDKIGVTTRDVRRGFYKYSLSLGKNPLPEGTKLSGQNRRRRAEFRVVLGRRRSGQA